MPVNLIELHCVVDVVLPREYIPSLQDVPGLLSLKAAVIGPSCKEDSRVCAIFDTWIPTAEPCQVPNCVACTLEHPMCGVYQDSTKSYTCSWRYVECQNSRVIKVLLGRDLRNAKNENREPCHRHGISCQQQCMLIPGCHEVGQQGLCKQREAV